MKKKEFISLILVFLVFGVITGGAFVGGLSMGERKGRAQAQQELSSQATTTVRSQAQPTGTAQNSGSQGISAGGGITGTIEKIEGDIITVSSTQGSVQVTVGQTTIIQKSSIVPLKELLPGQRLTIVGQRADDGTTRARSITLISEVASTSPQTDRSSRQGKQPASTP
ncbi:MAG: hypothetical protein Q7R34_14220 [Dehalococcoidia bacterium]|nr:hypothetical protein [Dehalococcoidia bacterium]